MTITILFNSGIEKVYTNLTSGLKECGDLKHVEFFYKDEDEEEHRVTITKDQIAVWDVSNRG